MDFLQPTEATCRCSLLKHSSFKREFIDFEGDTSSGVLLLLSHKRPTRVMDIVKSLFSTCGLTQYAMGYSLGCIPPGYENVTEKFPYIACKDANVSKRIKEMSPKFIITEGSAIRTIVEEANITVNSFFVPDSFKTYFWSKEFNCWVFPISEIGRIINFPEREKGEHERVLKNFHTHFAAQQIRKVVQFLKRPPKGISEDYKSNYVENPNQFLRDNWNVTEFAYDTETTGLVFYRDEVFCLLLSFDGETGHYLPWEKIDLKLLSEFFVGKETYAANYKFDYKFMKYAGVENVSCTFDVNYAGHILMSCRSNGLKEQTFYNLGLGGYDNELDRFKKKYKIKNYKTIPFDKMLNYACGDVCATFKLKKILEGMMDAAQRKYFRTYMEMTKVVCEMEMTGIQIDVDYLLSYRANLEKELKETEKRFIELVSPRLERKNKRLTEKVSIENLSSSENVKNIFVKGLGAHSTIKTEKNLESSGDTQLKVWGTSKDPVISEAAKLMLKFRETIKLITSFLSDGTKFDTEIKEEKDPGLFDISEIDLEEEEKKGRDTTLLRNLDESSVVHASFNLQRTVIYRLSCNSPNLQQLPIKSLPEFRPIFKARPGCYLAEADYSGFHLRLMAAISGDEEMCYMFSHPDPKKRDMHSKTAASIFTTYSLEEFVKKLKGGDDPEEVKLLDSYRSISKAINFGFLYGRVSSTFARDNLLLPPPEGWTEEQALSHFNRNSLSLSDRILKKLEKKELTEIEAKYYACAEDIRDKFFKTYPGVEKFINYSRDFAKRNGYVETLFGTKIYLPELICENFENEESSYSGKLNECPNYPVIGSETFIMHRTMVNLDKYFKSLKSIEVRILNNVHDSLLLEFPEKEATSSLGKDIHDIMIEPLPELKGVNLDSEAKYARYWGGHPDKKHPDAAKKWFE